jgi:hypothetical protein
MLPLGACYDLTAALCPGSLSSPASDKIIYGERDAAHALAAMLFAATFGLAAPPA